MAGVNEAVARLAAELGSLADRAAKARRKQEFCDVYGVSTSTLSRKLTALGHRQHERADKGRRRKRVSDHELMQVAALQRQSMSLRKGVVMPAEDALEIAEDSGMLPAGVVTPSYFNAWLRVNGAARRDQTKETPHVELRSLGPNHVHQMDFSLAVNWKCFQEKGEQKIQYERLIYKNKLPDPGQARLWRVVVTDHASGAFFVWYAESRGETVQATLEALYRAWVRKDSETERKFPFRGVPRILMVDRGPANKAGVTTALMERLGVTLNVCEGPRSKGQVERFHGWWEEHFESRMRLEPPSSVEQLNRWALDFMVKLNGVKMHTRHGMSRAACWSWFIGRREETKLRELACTWEQFKGIALSEPQRRLVGGSRTISFETRRYRVPDAFNPGEYVAVQYSVYSWPQVTVRAADVLGAVEYACDPIETDEFGYAKTAAVIGVEFKSQKRDQTATFTAAADEKFEELQQDESRRLRVFGHHAAKAEEIAARPAGEALEAGVAAAPVYSRVNARREVLERLGGRPFTAPEASYLASAFGEEVSEEEVGAAVAAIEAGVTAKVIEAKFGGEA